MANGRPTVDGLAAPSEPTPPTPAAAPAEKTVVRRWKTLLLIAGGTAYAFFVLWCLLLLTVLPSPDVLSGLVMAGTVSCIAAAIVLLVIGGFTLMHIAKTQASAKARQIALIKLVALILPGLLLTLFTPFKISGEPPISIAITKPTSADELIAPVPITFSVEKAVQTLSQRGFVPVQFRWDVNGDKEIDQETLEPTLVLTVEQAGVHTVTVTMQTAAGAKRSASKRFVIKQAVFSVTPSVPVVDQPVIFSLAHLFPEQSAVTSVSWDFDSDGSPDEETKGLQITHTFLRTGKAQVTATIALSNNTQATYTRSIDVTDPPQLPFPVTITTQPENLIGIPPFPVLFTVETKEPVHSVQWDFGDGQKSEGVRATHTYTTKGNFVVQSKVRSQSGVVAELSMVVKVVDKLDIPDLRFEGTPAVLGSKITGEVPLTLDIKPITQKAFVQFNWEAPDATEVGSTVDHLQAIYRRPGRYTLTLVGQDLENHVMRMPITVDVQPPSSLITITMTPETGVAPLSVKFDASESSIPGKDITGFIWNFGDGSQQAFGGALTQHTYNAAGTYVVSVIARTSDGQQENASKTLIVRAPVLQSRILASRLRGSAPLTVAFDGKSSTGDIGSYVWDFGDGTQNDGAEVEHTFVTPGTFTVRLIITDSSGKSSTSDVSITVD